VAIVNAGYINRDKLQAFKNELLKNASIQNVSADMAADGGRNGHINGATE